MSLRIKTRTGAITGAMMRRTCDQYDKAIAQFARCKDSSEKIILARLIKALFLRKQQHGAALRKHLKNVQKRSGQRNPDLATIIQKTEAFCCKSIPQPNAITRKILGGAAERKAAMRCVDSPAAMFAALKAMKRKKEPLSESARADLERELLEQEEREQAEARAVQTKSTGKRKKRTERSAPRKLPALQRAGPEASSPTDLQATPSLLSLRQAEVERLVLGMAACASPHILHWRVKRWDRAGLKGATLADWIRYGTLSKAQKREQVLFHTGIGIHRLLDDDKFRRDYIYEGDRGPLVWVTIHTTFQQEPLIGKIEFGIHIDARGRKVIHHRMFTPARPGEVNEFLLANPPGAHNQEEEDEELEEDEEIAGRLRVTAKPDGDLVFEQPLHAYARKVTVHRF